MSGTTSGENGSFGFQIAPMVDVVFVLLLFFMAAAGANFKEGFLQVPLTTGPSPESTELIFLDIDAAGTVFVNGAAMGDRTSDPDLAKLRQFLVKTMEAAPEDPVLIRPSLETRQDRVIAVLDACRSAQVKKLSFQ